VITFKTFLTESRSAPLYHASPKGLSILKDNALNKGKLKEPGLDRSTVSLTRNFIFAKNWLDEYGARDDGVIFELDQRKLSQNFKIVPYNFFANTYDKASAREAPEMKTFTKGKDYSFHNQFEEAVFADIKPLNRYVKTVWVGNRTDMEVTFLARGLGLTVKNYQKETPK